MEASIGKAKTVAVAIGAVCAVVLAGMVAIRTHEVVPDRAMFLVNTKQQYVVPRPTPGQFIFRPLPNQSDDDVFAQFDGRATWGEMKRKDHPYHEFDLPKNGEWDDFVFYGREVSLFRSLFFPPPSRWDGDGNWRY